MYSIEHRGGGMLEVYPNENTEITAILYTDVPIDVYESVVDSESQYNTNTVSNSDISFYRM